MPRTVEIRERMMSELEELETLTAAAPPEHPARVALATFREFVGPDGSRPSSDWYQIMQGCGVRMLANEIAKTGSVPTVR